jgi:hypothetical protein
MTYLESDKLPEDGGLPRKEQRWGTNVVEINNKYGAWAAIDHVTCQQLWCASPLLVVN